MHDRRLTFTAQYSIISIPRARRVHQTYASAILTTTRSFLVCQWRLALRPAFFNRRAEPIGSGLWETDLLLLNGPGSCVPLALIAFLPRVSGLGLIVRCTLAHAAICRQLIGGPSPTLVYVESWARARRLSLTGALLRPFVDRFVVQWPELRRRLDARDWPALRRLKLLGRVECAPLVL